mgnify:CR=1 FL=1
MNVKIFKTNILGKKKINNICELKSSFWKYSIRQHKNWFKKNINKGDLHFYYGENNKLFGYNSLRKQISINDKKKLNYFIFNTLIINKNFRKQGIAKLIMKKNLNLLKKNKQIAFLQCEKKHIKFYKNLKWRLVNKNKISIKIRLKRKINLMFVNFSQNDFFTK